MSLLAYARVLAEVAFAPAASRQQSPATDGFIWLALPIVAFVIWIVVAAFRRSGPSAGKRGLFTRGGGAVGNALNDLNSMLMPNRPDAVVMQELDEKDERDDAGDDRNSR